MQWFGVGFQCYMSVISWALVWESIRITWRCWAYKSFVIFHVLQLILGITFARLEWWFSVSELSCLCLLSHFTFRLTGNAHRPGYTGDVKEYFRWRISPKEAFII